ncbi:MFS transporter [Leucobacter ruminantium]|uniref:MFS transporter n=1 Tax=Leucobacter ruminantium TaxID=1289170 RepID=A0A939LYA9_9MICO|nr:MFS transporter [Leucobacter ruminantium]MBO1806341.1 MFS transporter [Leucobacter ruminantium]
MARLPFGALSGTVAAFAFVEFTSGWLQGYYAPMATDIARYLGIADADLNWLEGAQLMLSALVVPLLARLGDLFGHRRMLLVSAAITAAATLALPLAETFPVFLLAWALQGVYVVWLPLAIALIWVRVRGRADSSRITARAAGVLIVSLQAGALLGALLGGALADMMPIRIVLLVPGLLVLASCAVIHFGVGRAASASGGPVDLPGFGLLVFVLLPVLGGLSLLRVNGAADPRPWVCIAAGAAAIVPFLLWESRRENPFVDVRLFGRRALGPVFLCTALFGVSVLGAQVPLTTFVRSDPALSGYGLGATGSSASIIIALYLASMMIGAFAYSRRATRFSPSVLLPTAACLVALGYLLLVPFHSGYGQVITSMMIAGAGSGALLAALPALAVERSPERGSGITAGLSNSSKMLGGAAASAVFGLVLIHGTGAWAGPAGAASAGTADPAAHAAPLSGYIAVWVICGCTALVAAVLLRSTVGRAPRRGAGSSTE